MSSCSKYDSFDLAWRRFSCLGVRTGSAVEGNAYFEMFLKGNDLVAPISNVRTTRWWLASGNFCIVMPDVYFSDTGLNMFRGAILRRQRDAVESHPECSPSPLIRWPLVTATRKPRVGDRIIFFRLVQGDVALHSAFS